MEAHHEIREWESNAYYQETSRLNASEYYKTNYAAKYDCPFIVYKSIGFRIALIINHTNFDAKSKYIFTRLRRSLEAKLPIWLDSAFRHQ